jgi:hypothetical protein
MRTPAPPPPDDRGTRWLQTQAEALLAQVVPLLAAGPCPAWRPSPRRCATSARQVDVCPMVTCLASKVHRQRVLFPCLQLFDHGLEVLQLLLHALMRIKGIPLISLLTSVAQRI